MGSFSVLLGGSWGLFWCSWGLQVVPRILKTFYLGTLEPPSCPPRSPQQPQTAPQTPSWRGRGPHEATKSYLDTYFNVFSCDLVAKSKKKENKIHRSSLSKRVYALELFLHLLHHLPLPHYHYKSKMKTKTTTRTNTRTKIKTKIETEIKLRLGLRLKLRCRRRF